MERQTAWKKWVKKKVFLILQNNNQYSGEIVSIDDAGNGLIFLNLIDKFNKLVTFTTGEIKLIQEKSDDR